jgi:hypothetical protein
VSAEQVELARVKMARDKFKKATINFERESADMPEFKDIEPLADHVAMRMLRRCRRVLNVRGAKILVSELPTAALVMPSC